jgi:hypothetical protein
VEVLIAAIHLTAIRMIESARAVHAASGPSWSELLIAAVTVAYEP